MVDKFAAVFICMPVDRASDSMMARPKAVHFSSLGTELFSLLLGPPGCSNPVLQFFLFFPKLPIYSYILSKYPIFIYF